MAAVDVIKRECVDWTDASVREVGVAMHEELLRRQTNAAVHGEHAMARDTAQIRTPFLGDDVLYRSRTGDYWLSARVARTDRSSSSVALGRAKEHGIDLAILTPTEVDLVVFSPGGAANSPHGTYFERCIPHDPNGQPGTWCWPIEVQGERP